MTIADFLAHSRMLAPRCIVFIADPHSRAFAGQHPFLSAAYHHLEKV